MATPSRKKKVDAAALREQKARERIAKRYQRLEVENQPRGPQFLLVLLCLLGAALVAYGIFGPQAEDEDPLAGLLPTDGEETVALTDPLVDPDALRAPIEDFERSLFLAGGGLDDLGQQIAIDASALADAATELPGSHAQQLAEGVAQIAVEAEDGTFSLEELERLRARWPALRKRHLTASAWFRQASPRDRDRAAIGAYSDAAEDLERSIVAAALRAGALVEDEPSGIDERDLQLAAWASAAEAWREELDAIDDSLPPRPPSNASSEFLDAVQRLESALRQARRLAADDRLVVRRDPMAAFEAPVRDAEDARRRLGGLSLD